MPDPFEQLWSPHGRQRADGNPMQPPTPQMPGQPQGGEGYFGRLMSDPTFLTGASVLSGGLAGQDFGTALGRGTQAASGASEMFDRRRKHAAWGKIFGPNGPNMESPLLKGVPPEYVPLIQQLGPDEGMNALLKIAFKRMEPRQLTSVAPGASLYDERTQQEVYRAPMNEKPPSGYRDAGGGSLEAIPGGPATQVSGDQAGRVALMRQARGDLGQAKEFYKDMGVTGRLAHSFGIGEAGQAKRTVQSAIEATLRALSGAAAPQSEVDRFTDIFAPQNLDRPETRADKLRRLEEFITDAEQTIMQGRGGMPQQPGQQQPRGSGRPDDPLGILD